MPMNVLCPECGGKSVYAGSDAQGTIYTCQSADRTCVVFDHWDHDVRTYRASHRGGYRSMDDDED